MKKNLVITQRDKRLLILLCALIIGFLDYYFVIDPALLHGSELKQTAYIARQELNQAKTLVENASSIKGEEAATRAELTEKYAGFFYRIDQERILYQLDTLMQKSGFNPAGCKFGEMTLTNTEISVNAEDRSSYPILDSALGANPSLSEFVRDDSPSEGETNADPLPDDVIPTYDVTISYTDGGYAALMRFLDELEGMNKSLLIKGIEMNKSGNTLNGEIIVAFYALPKVDASESSYLEFVPSTATGKSDPFN